MNRAALPLAPTLALLCVAVPLGCGPAPYSLDPETPAPARAEPERVTVVVVPAPAPVPVTMVAAPAPAPSPAVLATLRRHEHKFHKCYGKAWRRDRNLHGTIIVRVVLDDDGDVDSARDWGGDLPDRDVRECIIDVMEDIEFPKSAGSQVFVYPMTFEPRRRFVRVR